MKYDRLRTVYVCWESYD